MKVQHKTILTLSGIGILFLGIMFIYTFNEIERNNQNMIFVQIKEVDHFSNLFELRINFMKEIVETASTRVEIMGVPTLSENITEQNKGILQNEEVEMRKIATDMLDQDLSFEYFFYVLSNGDMYFLEPFEDQLDLIWLNYAFRDWYTGAIMSENTYLSEVYVSAATGHNVLAISVPMYDVESTEKKLNGVWVGTIDLSIIDSSFHEIGLDDNQYVLVIDDNNNIVVDSRNGVVRTELKEFQIDLRDKSDLSTSNYITKKINGVDMFIVFKSIPMDDKIWMIVQVQPHITAFELHYNLIITSIIVSGTILGSLIIIGMTIFRNNNRATILKEEIKERETQRKSDAKLLEKMNNPDEMVSCTCGVSYSKNYEKCPSCSHLTSQN